MIPFLVDMNALFERFVAEWLKSRLPKQYELRYSHNIPFGDLYPYHCIVDMIIIDRATREVLCVLDTKYKNPEASSTDDIQQVVAYAEATGCRTAALIYPTELERPLLGRVGEIQVRSMAFNLEGDLEETGTLLLAGLQNLVAAEIQG